MDPFTSQLWRDIEDIVTGIGGMFSIPTLPHGDFLSEEASSFIAQEVWYLHQVLLALLHLTTRAPCAKEQVLWSSVAQGALVRTPELSNSALEEVSSVLEDIEPTAITQFLLNAHSSYSVFNPYRIVVTSIVVEMWIAAELTLQGRFLVDEDSMIAEWVEIHPDPKYVDSVQWALEVLEENMPIASDAEFRPIRNIFRRAIALEREAYAQPGHSW